MAGHGMARFSMVAFLSMSQPPQPPQLRLLHLGCALTAPPQWVNLDGSWNAWLARKPWLKAIITGLRLIPASNAALQWPANIIVHDLRKPLPFADASFDAVYSSHTVEHLYRSQALAMLREAYRVLKPGGICRNLVPDLRALVEEYLGQRKLTGEDTGRADDPARQFNYRLYIMPETPQRRGLLYRLYTNNSNFHQHKQMYDTDSLKRLMAEAGFSNCQPALPLQSKIPLIELVERPDRTIDGAIVEGVKPGLA